METRSVDVPFQSESEIGESPTLAWQQYHSWASDELNPNGFPSVTAEVHNVVLTARARVVINEGSSSRADRSFFFFHTKNKVKI